MLESWLALATEIRGSQDRPVKKNNASTPRRKVTRLGRGPMRTAPVKAKNLFNNTGKL